ncbi:MAG: hypothetical protein GF315_04740 [candidate division Zixibacteria bacterium]|nr:hypothetical protein [candidate division Zixibacteria bacterium]
MKFEKGLLSQLFIAISLVGLVVYGLLSCTPEPALIPADDFIEADIVYYRDLIVFVEEDTDQRDILVCDLGREKKQEVYTGEFWGCFSRDGSWHKLRKTGKYRLLTSRPSIPEGPPGVEVSIRGCEYIIDYTDSEDNFVLESDCISIMYKESDTEDLRIQYGLADAKLKIGDEEIEGRILCAFTRWVNYEPITAEYRNRYKDFLRFMLFNDDVFVLARENGADMMEFASKNDLEDSPKAVNAYLSIGGYRKSFNTFKLITTDRSYDLALFRVPFGWEIEFDKENSLIVAGEDYYLDNKILTGRAFIEITGALNSRGDDHELVGICEFIK